MTEDGASQAAGRRAAANTAFRAVGELGGKFGTFALFAVMARELPVSDVGKYVLAFAYVQIATVLIDLGFDRAMIRQVSVDHDRMPELFTNTVALKFLLAVPVTAASWGLASLLYDGTTLQAIYIFSIGLFLDSLNRTIAAIMTSRERSGLLSGAIIVERISGAAMGIAAVLSGMGIVTVAATYAIGSGLGFLFGFALAERYIGSPTSVVTRSTWPDLLREAVPFALYDSFQFTFSKIDTIVLSLLGTASMVGYYGAASRLYEASFFVALSLDGAFVAMFTYLTATSVPTIGDVYERAIKLALVLLVPISVTLCVLAEPICTFLFGPDFEPAASALRLLSPSVALMGVALLSTALVSLRAGPRRVLAMTGSMLLLNIALNIALVPSMGADGSGLAMSLSICVYAVLALILAGIEVGRPPFGRMLGSPLISGAAMALVMLVIPQPGLALLAGGLVFAAVFVVSERLIAPDDLRFAIQLARTRGRAGGTQPGNA